MSDATDAVAAPAVPAPDAAFELEEKREKRNLKFWLVKASALTFFLILAVSLSMLVYAAVVKDKDLDTGYLGAIIKGLFEFMQFLLT